MFTELGIVYGDGRPRINASLAELMDLDLGLFLLLDPPFTHTVS